MGKRTDPCDRRDNCVPVDPLALFRLLAHALDIPVEGEAEPMAVVSRKFPDMQAANFRDLYLLKEILRKYPGFDLGIDTEEVAIRSFLQDEATNLLTNDRLRTWNKENPCVEQIILSASRKALGVLGDFRWEDWVQGTRFGPGATTRLPAAKAGDERKLSGIPHVHANAHRLAETLISITPQWAYAIMSDPDFDGINFTRVVEGDTFLVVPKNAKTGRGITPQTDVAGYMQLGMGYAMRSRMFSAGINLQNQGINQDLAKEASLTGKKATLDVRSASNSLTYMLVYRLLGAGDSRFGDLRWFAMLDALRSDGCTLPNSQWHEYALFSAMGNGFTFELESLCFWALARSCCEYLGLSENDVSVYGDDLIVPVGVVDLLKEILGWCGFGLNDDKSFWNTDGPRFRESCGEHFLDGKNVSPIYCEELLNTADQIILLINGLTRWAASCGVRDGRLLPVVCWLEAHLSLDVRECRVPYGESDDGIISDFDEVCPAPRYLRSDREIARRTGAPLKTFMGYEVRTVSVHTREVELEGDDRMVVALYKRSFRKFRQPEARSVHEFFVPGLNPALIEVDVLREVGEALALKTTTSQKKSLKFRKRVVQSWPLLGPWVDESGQPEVVVRSRVADLIREMIF